MHMPYYYISKLSNHYSSSPFHNSTLSLSISDSRYIGPQGSTTPKMKLSFSNSLIGFASALSLFADAAAAVVTSSLILSVPTSHILPNPWILPPTTHATLSTLHKSLTAQLTTANTFVFHNLTSGSYLVDVHSTLFAFMPLRLDILPSPEDPAKLTVAAWETYRGNSWDNKGEAIAIATYDGGIRGLEVRALGAKQYFMERSKCKPASL
jgi:ER membrane protein complex subunit 7